MKNLIVIILISLFGCINAQIDTPDEYQPENRIALVIGNGNYPSNKLPNPENDASAMAEVLEKLDFDVYKYENLNKSQMDSAINDFGGKLEKYDVCLFYYSGQGYQIGQTLLVPIDAIPESEDDVLHQCLGLDFVEDIMGSANIDVNIIMLEASRFNPFLRKSSPLGLGNDYRRPDKYIIGWATPPGGTALVGEDNHGLYTSAILECIETPNITIENMFKEVRKIVYEISGGRQVPWEATSLAASFYFVTGFTGTGIVGYNPTQLSIYPNPTNNLLTIETTNLEPHTIEIYSLNSQLIYRTKSEGPTLQMDLSSFHKGLYFITVRSMDYVRTEQIIKLN